MDIKFHINSNVYQLGRKKVSLSSIQQQEPPPPLYFSLQVTQQDSKRYRVIEFSYSREILQIPTVLDRSSQLQGPHPIEKYTRTQQLCLDARNALQTT